MQTLKLMLTVLIVGLPKCSPNAGERFEVPSVPGPQEDYASPGNTDRWGSRLPLRKHRGSEPVILLYKRVANGSIRVYEVSQVSETTFETAMYCRPLGGGENEEAQEELFEFSYESADAFVELAGRALAQMTELEEIMGSKLPHYEIAMTVLGEACSYGRMSGRYDEDFVRSSGADKYDDLFRFLALISGGLPKAFRLPY